MNYLAWALFAEGRTDIRYLETLLPRVVLHLIQRAVGPEAMVPDFPVDVFGVDCRDLDTAAVKICTASEAFQLLFVHGDTGSPAQEQHLENRTCALCGRVESRCGILRDRCVVVAPRQETEAWCLVDKAAIRSAYGVGNGFDLSFIPDAANVIESIQDPKDVLRQIHNSLPGGRRRKNPPIPYANLGQIQDLSRLMLLPSFKSFELRLIAALRTLGYPGLE